MPVVKTTGVPAVPLAFTGTLMIVWLAVLATNIAVRWLLNSMPLAPKGGLRPLPGMSNGLDASHCVRLLPFLSVFQIMPWKESEI